MTCSLLSIGEIQADVNDPRLDSVISQAQAHLIRRQMSDGLWDFPAYLGTYFISQYYLVRQWLGLKEDHKMTQRLRQQILLSQQSDGSWYAVHDANIPPGDLNATLWNYLALKAMPSEEDDFEKQNALEKARGYILSQGGIESCNLLSKTFLAAMKMYDWKRLPRIPRAILDKNFPVNVNHFGQWVGPHLKAMAFLRFHRLQRSIGIDAEELWVTKRKRKFIGEKTISSHNAKKIQSTLLKDQQPGGSWGGYTESTILNMMALSKSGMDQDDVPFQKALSFVEQRYFDNGAGSYLGSLQDGRYWDSILAGQALLDSGFSMPLLTPTVHSLLEQQQANGGIPFGKEFEYAPDVDDTAELILFLAPYSQTRGDFSPAISSDLRSFVEKRMTRAMNWIEEMQNRDGGWGAFAKDNHGNFLINLFANSFSDSVDFFDESSADVTGHVLEAFGRMGFHIDQNYYVLHRAIKYLKKSQDAEFGSWMGRWGINHIYGTSAALVGLTSIGESPDQPYIRKAINWLKSAQNRDGGFGESTQSYLDRSWIGHGISTPSQTAWALSALISCGEMDSESATRAVNYLITEFEESGMWMDSSTVGTGHPGIVYMNYPSYPFTFPLLALGRYRSMLRH